MNYDGFREERGDKLANEKNLLPGRITTEEAPKLGRMGGLASAESRRKRKALKETMEVLLSLPVSDRRRLTKAAKLGLAPDDIDNSTLVAIALWDKAISGDVPAIKELRALVDEGGSDTGQLEQLIKGLANADVQP